MQHSEEPTVPEIAKHLLNSHGLGAMRKKLVVKRTCWRRVDAVQDRQLLEQNLTEYIRPAKTQSVAAVRTESLLKAMSAEGKHDETVCRRKARRDFE